MDTADERDDADGRSAGASPAQEASPSSFGATSGTDDDIAAEAAPILSAAPALAKWLLIYSVLRIALLLALAAALSLVMPLIVALLFAVVLALPLSFLLFAGVRRRVNEAIAFSTARRRSERERLRAALNGDDQH